MTQISDIIEPAVFTNYLSEYTPEKYILLQNSGILAAPPSEVSSQFLAGGMTIDMPYWDDLTRGEPTIPNDTQTDITPDAIGTHGDKATKHILAKAWNSMSVSGMVATGSMNEPMEEVGRKVGNWWYEATEQRIIRTLTGVFADNAANNSSDMIASVYQDIAAPTAANRISIQAVNEATLTMGDQMDQFSVICMHTHVYNTLKNDEQITFVRPSETPMQVPYYGDPNAGGLLVLYSDMMPVVSGTNAPKYTCYLCAPGAFAYMDHVPTTSTFWGTEGVEIQRSATKGLGGGEDIMVTRRRQMLHPRGVKWNDTARANKMAPTYAELANATNWTRVHQRKNVRMAALEVNVNANP